MKKALKITLKLLAGLAGVLIIVAAVYYVINLKTVKFFNAVYENDYKTMESMLNAGYNPNTDTFLGKPMNMYVFSSPLLDPAHPFDINVAKFLLEHGVSPNYDAPRTASLVFFATLANNEKYVQLLIKHRADINRGVKNHTPLDVAYILQHDDIISLLAKHGADIGIAVKLPIMATRVMEYYMRGITDERPVLQLIGKNFHSREQLLEFFVTAQKQTNDFYKTENKDYDRKKILTIINNYDR